MSNILIIDDDRMLCEMVCRKLRNLGHESSYALDLSEGFNAALRVPFDLILLDVCLPDGSGIAALSKMKSIGSNPEIIIITGEGDPDGAELAIATGAWDYIAKPLSMRAITLQIARVLDYRHKKRLFKPAALLKKEGIVGEAPKLNACLEQIAHGALTDAPILITGETGTGKELFARAVHANSHREAGPFVVLDCAAVAENLVESMLFGHCKGAFTGAEKNSDGLILQAHKGTLFMDEIGELSLATQKTFLRVLQEHRFRPVGDRCESISDFRLVAATNRNLEDMVNTGEFRKDLFFRINATTIHLPSLRERPSDIEFLTRHYISSFCKQKGLPLKGVSPEVIQHFLAYEWPGNIRELANTIEIAIGNALAHDILYPMHLPVGIRVRLKRLSFAKEPMVPKAGTATPAGIDRWPSLKASIEQSEREYFLSLMARIGSDIKTACKISGLSRSALYGRFKKYGIERCG